MDALISAQAGTALLIEGSELASIHAGAPEKAIPRRAEEAHLLFGEAADLQVLQGVDSEQVVRRLMLEATVTEALQLALILLDPEVPEDIRREAAADLDGWLTEEVYQQRLEGVLYAHALPAAADLTGSRACSKACDHIQDFLYRLATSQPAITEVRHAWTALPEALFSNPAQRKRFETALVREELFRDFVLLRQAGTSFEPFLATSLLNPVLREIPGYRAVIKAWVAPFRWQGTADVPSSPSEATSPFSDVATQPTAVPAERAMAGTRASRRARWAILIPAYAAALALLVAAAIMVANLVSSQSTAPVPPDRSALGRERLVQPSRPPDAIRHETRHPELARVREMLQQGIAGVRADLDAQRFTAARERLNHLQETIVPYRAELSDEVAQMRALDQEITTARFAALSHQRDKTRRAHSNPASGREHSVEPSRPPSVALAQEIRLAELAWARETLREGIVGVHADLEAQRFTAARERLNRLQETAVLYPADLSDEVAQMRALDQEITSTQIAFQTAALARMREEAKWQRRLEEIQGLLQEKSYPEAKRLSAKLAGDREAPAGIADRAREFGMQADQALKDIFASTRIRTKSPGTEAQEQRLAQGSDPQAQQPKNVKEWVTARKRKSVSGAITGSVLGGLLARLRGQNVARGAAAGAVVGGVAVYLTGHHSDQIQYNRDEAMRIADYQSTDGYVIRIEDVRFEPQRIRPGQSATLHIRYLVIGPDPQETIKVNCYRGIKYQGSYMTGEQATFKVPNGGGVVDSTVEFTLPAEAPAGTYDAETLIEDAQGRVNASGISPLYIAF